MYDTRIRWRVCIYSSIVLLLLLYRRLRSTMIMGPVTTCGGENRIEEKKYKKKKIKSATEGSGTASRGRRMMTVGRRRDSR